MTIKQLLVLAIILILSVGITVSADATKKTDDTKDQGKDIVIDGVKDNPPDGKDVKKNETIIDVTTETSKEIKKDIGVSVKDKAAELVNYDVKKEKDKITISKDDTKGHTRTILTLDKATAQSIDVDKDNKFSVSRWVGGQFVSSKIVTLAELTGGTEVVFSKTIVNGLTGTRTTTFLNVTSGQTLNIQDASPDAVTVSVGGAVPSYVAGIPANGLIAYWDFNTLNNSVNVSKYPLTLYGNAFISGGALHLDGTGDYALAGRISEVENIAQISAYSDFAYSSTSANSGKYPMIFGSRYPLGEGPFAIRIKDGSNPGYMSFLTRNTSNSLTTIDATSTYVVNTRYSMVGTISGQVVTMDINGITQTGTGVFVGTTDTSTANALFGRGRSTGEDDFNGTIYAGALYTTGLNSSHRKQLYAGGSGISFQPEPAHNFTGYDVSSGVPKTLDIDSTVTGIEYVDTTGGTHPVTVVEYYTNDTAVITDSHTSTQQTVNISHSVPATMDSGTLLPYPILDGYDGTATLTSDNVNATLTRNETHFIINTGYLPAGVTKNYLVKILKYRTTSVFTKTGLSQNVSQTLTISPAFASNKTSSARVNISTTAYSEPYDEVVNETAWYRFDSTSGTTIIDSSGHGYNGTAYNGPTWVTGKYNNGMMFDNVNDYVSIPHVSAFNLSSGFTIAMTLNGPFSTSAIDQVMCKNSAGAPCKGYGLYVTNGVPIFRVGSGGGTFVDLSAITTLSPNRYHQIVGVYNGTHTKLYVDKVLKNTASAGTIQYTSVNMIIGAATTTPTLQYNGTIDNIIILPYAANITTINQLYLDNLAQLQAKTNANSTYSGMWNSSNDNPLTLPVSSLDGLISSIQFKVPVNITTPAGTKIYYFNQTAAPFIPSVTITSDGSEGDIITVAEATGNQYYWSNLTLNPGQDYTSKSWTYPKPAGCGGIPVLYSNNTAAVIDTYNATHFTIDMGALTANEPKYYNVRYEKYRTSGAYTVTSYNVTSGTTIDVPDGAYTGAEVRVGGSVPSYVALNENTSTSYPSYSKMILAMPMWNKRNLVTNMPATTTNVSFVNGRSVYNTSSSTAYYAYHNFTNTNTSLYVGATIYPTSWGGNNAGRIFSKTNQELSINSATSGLIYWHNGTQYTSSSSCITLNKTQFVEMYYNTTLGTVRFWVNGVLVGTKYIAKPAVISTDNVYIGNNKFGARAFSGYIDNIYSYRSCNFSTGILYTSGSGISFQPEPSYNFTGYNVDSGIAKTLDIDSTVTGIEVVNTANTVLQSVTATLQMDTSSDIINVIESTSGQQHWANITLNPGKDYTDYVFTYPRPTGWTGSATLISNNTAATVTSNNTHFMIDMGPLTTNETKYYNVAVGSGSTDFTAVHFVAGITFVGAAFVLAVGAFNSKRRSKN